MHQLKFRCFHIELRLRGSVGATCERAIHDTQQTRNLPCNVNLNGAMSSRRTTAIWTILVFGILGVILTIVLLYSRQPVVLRGAILLEVLGLCKHQPLADVFITATNGLGSVKYK